MSNRTQTTASLPVSAIRAIRAGRVKDGRLLPASSTVSSSARKAPPTLLEQFIRIVSAEDKEAAAVAFAQRWGLLELCGKHGLPVGHNAPAHHDQDCTQAIDNLRDYVRFAACLDALRQIGEEIRNVRPGGETHWAIASRALFGFEYVTFTRHEEAGNVIRGGAYEIRKEFRRRTLSGARFEFRQLIRQLIRVSRVQPSITWDKAGLTIEFDAIIGSNLPAILATQLIAQLSGKALRKCRDCPNWFQPRRRQVYCDTCGIRAAWRAASSRLAGKRKQADSKQTRT